MPDCRENSSFHRGILPLLERTERQTMPNDAPTQPIDLLSERRYETSDRSGAGAPGPYFVWGRACLARLANGSIWPDSVSVTVVLESVSIIKSPSCRVKKARKRSPKKKATPKPDVNQIAARGS